MTITRVGRVLVIAMAMAVGGWWAGPVGRQPAQAQERPQQQAPQAADPADISDQELEAFAKSYVALWQINSAYTQRLQSVRDEERAKTLQREADARMRDALEQNGLTGERYQAIYTAVVKDPELQAQANDAIRRVQE